MRKKILILGGGISRERLISLETAKSVFKELKKKNYTALICEPDGNLSKKIKSFKPNIIFNALHGQFGEDGYIQAILESQRIKYTHPRLPKTRCVYIFFAARVPLAYKGNIRAHIPGPGSDQIRTTVMPAAARR